MTTVPELQAENDNSALVRKILRAVAFLAPMTVELPDALTDETGELQPLPVGFLPVGIVTPEGYRFSADMQKEDVDALGYASPVRSDITQVPRQVTFTALEFGRKHMLELKHGVDLSNVEQSAGGEITFDESDLPIGAEYRLVVIGDDGPASANWILGKGYPRVKLASAGEEAWSKEGALTQEFTLDVFTDQEIGTPVRHYIAGTGAKAAADALGFTQAS